MCQEKDFNKFLFDLLGKVFWGGNRIIKEIQWTVWKDLIEVGVRHEKGIKFKKN